ncbi:hypothetical protein CLOM_g502 [Closterium sp. NIES-68]|nr:hypothetical protein CLOM_g502 [Closterium sp. NIES-68]
MAEYLRFQSYRGFRRSFRGASRIHVIPRRTDQSRRDLLHQQHPPVLVSNPGFLRGFFATDDVTLRQHPVLLELARIFVSLTAGCRSVAKANGGDGGGGETPAAGVSVLRCLERYTAEERLEGGNQMCCENCNRKTDASRRVCVRSVPPVLNLHLMRFVFDAKTMSKKKVTAGVRIPLASTLPVCATTK